MLFFYVPVLTVFPDIGVNIGSIDFNITTTLDEFNGGTAFFCRQVDAKCQFKCREKLSTCFLKIKKKLR